MISLNFVSSLSGRKDSEFCQQQFNLEIMPNNKKTFSETLPDNKKNNAEIYIFAIRIVIYNT